MRFKNRDHLHNIKAQGGVANADVQVAANYPDLTKITNESGYTKQEIFDASETPIGRTFHPGLL